MFGTAILALAFAVATAPATKAEDKPSEAAPAQPAAAPATAQPASAASASVDTQQKLQDLEKEVGILEQEIAALKASSTPAVTNAAYHPDAAVAAVNAPPALPDDAPQKVSLAGLLGPVTLSGFVDAYYGYNPAHPFDNKDGLRFFEADTNAFSFNMAELILDKAPDLTSTGPEARVGYHVSAGYGQAASVVNNSDLLFTDGSNFFIKEAYLSYVAPVGKGLTITVGKFVTNAGAEVIESNANWNYSRSLLFYYAIPFFHFGAKAAYTFNPKWSVNVSLVNGWNNTTISHDPAIVEPVTEPGIASSGLTYGGTVAFTPNAKWSFTENYYAGPVIDQFGAHSKTVNDWKQLSDSIIGYTPTMKWAFQVNGDYGTGPKLYGCEVTCVAETPAMQWWGAAGYAKYTLNAKNNFAVRYEYYCDPDGFTILGAFDPHLHYHVQEVTGTYTWNLTNSLMIRGEYRYDFSSLPIFTRGTTPESRKEQNTALIAFVYSFSSANAK